MWDHWSYRVVIMFRLLRSGLLSRAPGVKERAKGDFAVAPQKLVSRDDIARRAFQLYMARGRVHGYDVADWLAAEQELREMYGRTAGRRRVRN
jgi:Protein of unknown function (DUF2934)